MMTTLWFLPDGSMVVRTDEYRNIKPIKRGQMVTVNQKSYTVQSITFDDIGNRVAILRD